MGLIKLAGILLQGIPRWLAASAAAAVRFRLRCIGGVSAAPGYVWIREEALSVAARTHRL